MKIFLIKKVKYFHNLSLILILFFLFTKKKRKYKFDQSMLWNHFTIILLICFVNSVVELIFYFTLKFRDPGTIIL
jgi:O-antigen/teichoic acid export membrane protein